MTRQLLKAGVASALALSGFVAGAPQASAYTQTSAVVERTGGIGVGCRTAPFGPIDCGYGAPEGHTVQLGCFYRYGDPVGPNRNTLWWRVSYGGKEFFVADHWLDTPAPVNQSPTWYHNGPGCQ